MADLNEIVDTLSSLTVMQAAELAKLLEEKWGVSAAAPVAAPAETVAELAPASAAPEVAPSDSPVHDSHWEEVNTKLDLAKAYEEMGDLEGARELLQEVVGEGSVDLVEQARTILGRIGE